MIVAILYRAIILVDGLIGEVTICTGPVGGDNW